MIHPLLFLDIDGVLNCSSWWKHPEHKRLAALHLEADAAGLEHAHLLRGKSHLYPKLCARLEDLHQAVPGLQTVISSTWRINYELDELMEMIHQTGAPSLRAIDRTDSLRCHHKGRCGSCHRGLEIEHWIAHNVPLKALGELKMVILDDDSDMSRLRCVHVQTSFHKGGLLPRHVERCVQVLSEPQVDFLKAPNKRWTEKGLGSLPAGKAKA